MKTNNKRDQEYLKTLTILYVEDDADTREQFSDFLRRSAGTLITAENGVAGLEAFKKQIPDIVVTDILMPRMDGLTMAKEILEMVPKVPIIVVTAFEQTDYLMRAKNIGIEKYVTKPVNSYLLFEKLLECAHRLRAEEQIKLQHQQEIREAQHKQSKAIAIMAGGIAHDYNNMMQGILGYTALAKMLLEPGSEASSYKEPKNDGHTAQAALEQQFAHLREAAAARIVASITTIEQALIRGDNEIVREEGHRIKGLGMSLGIPDAESIGTALEQAGLDARLESVPELLDSLR